MQDEVAAAFPGPLPQVVGARLAALAAATLAALPDRDVPVGLQAVRRFTPARRARLGAAALRHALDVDDGFRLAVIGHLPEQAAELVARLRAGEPLALVDPVEVAAVAYLLRVDGWPGRVAAAGQSPDGARTSGDPVEDRPAEGEADTAPATTRLSARVAGLEQELNSERTAAAAVRDEVDQLRRRLRGAEGEARRRHAGRAQQQEAALEAALVAARSAQDTTAAAVADQQVLRERLADAEHALAAARRDVRAVHEAGQARLRVLLDTLAGAAAGLRRELDLPAVVARPADLASATGEPVADGLAGVLDVATRGPVDAAVVDAALTVPGLHLVVDGYNVTKLGYGTATLSGQRSRLLAGLAGLVGRMPTGGELTCVFDATAVSARSFPGSVPRGVRVLWSAEGELADDVVVRLVRAEPPGRPVLVVTNDRELVARVEAAGGRAVASGALLARLERT